ncbi:hypothetical protein CAEBREN_19139 [Caenorhabditis brenneri]|uniref:F-box domain-containing protein n=1 Tax=Caenorhabditis brenneri TaxID=135651 RepID=G0P388_CAEBE|nr:hypothetical protein CAEBREN_19139 [Caenorhabditis brenneri]
MFTCCFPFRKMNSKIEEISDPCHPNLPNMPKVVMEEVLKNLDCRSIFCLRKVCHDLFFSIDKIKPDLHLDSVRFELPITTSSIESYFENSSESVKESFMGIYQPRTGCRIKSRHNYVEIPMEDAESLLKNPKLILDELHIDLRLYTAVSDAFFRLGKDLKKFFETMKFILEGPQLLKAKSVELSVHNLSEAAEILKFIDPKSLKSISIVEEDWSLPKKRNEMNFGKLVDSTEMDMADGNSEFKGKTSRETSFIFS